ncbi:MAG: hypothetical protein JEZ05_04265 [Tenericutes bacterium]|nr:hypothetical protein [Mycoplasmatota bacterium]
MKKFITLAVLGLLSLTLVSCNNLEYSAYTEETSYAVFDNYFINRNQVISIDYEIIEQLYEYDTIEYFVTNEDVVTVNYLGNVKGKDPGVSLVKATLYDGKVGVANIVIGYFINIDMDSDRMIPINNYLEFQTLLLSNTYGSLYLADDIEFPSDFDFTMISRFKGMLINPYGYTITGLKGSSAIFGLLENAYIDGIIIADSSFSGVECAALAKESSYSYITNTHVFTTTITATGISGGLVADSTNTTYEFVSFEGGITSSDYVGGLFGTVTNGLEGYSEYIDNFLINSYAYATISVTDNTKHGSGLIGLVVSNAKIESCYFLGSITSDTVYQFSKDLDSSKVYYISLYTNLDIDNLASSDYASFLVYQVTEYELFTGSVLPGLEAFIFEEAVNPRN